QGAGYPSADAQGGLSYRSTESVKALGKALDKRYDIERIDPERRVVYLHGVAEDAKLPESVRSLPGVPARVTLPVACANLVPVPN
ncbi:MAG TPA: hypothetical protein VLW45_11850, partial [Pelomicrobium sp.]|nr:hypothetical protein [Pelomicrobium sp.]